MYRVVLFQRAPSIVTSNVHLLPCIMHGNGPKGAHQFSDLRHLVVAFCNAHGPRAPDSFLKGFDMYSLSALLVLAWHGIRTRPNSREADTLWPPSIFDMALDRWLGSHSGDARPSDLLLFHLGSIVLHTHMPSIHRLLQHMGSGGLRKHQVPIALKEWHLTDDREIATLHASHLLKTSISIIGRPTQGEPYSEDSEVRNGRDEPPHAPICIYLAVVTLWAAEVSSLRPDPHMTSSYLEQGCGLLARCRLSVAARLRRTLELVKGLL